MDKSFIENVLGNACNFLYSRHKNLIDERAHERTIVSFMVPNLQSSFPEFTVINDYNREGDLEERKTKSDLEGNPFIPDLIVHEYGPQGRNLLAVEVKGYWNRESREIDKDKLRKLRLKHHYEFTYRIELGRDTANVIEVLPQ